MEITVIKGKYPSWIVIDKATKRPMLEIFDVKIINLLDKNKYEAIPVDEYIEWINAKRKKYG